MEDRQGSNNKKLIAGYIYIYIYTWDEKKDQYWRDVCFEEDFRSSIFARVLVFPLIRSNRIDEKIAISSFRR